ncbi:MAG: class III signal peptide-containing protein [Candidatus Diapherotrites archaeon]|uniref:Class III signal peptide-containing protein n=1 Tax=Candidatus Iainarchaeum sp. TaxID=3101447 RepID=A0A8T3YKL9_9ARCH|nr:class III signal peptide-containing protein [Candidatus Diapherotrites archaeon]
MPRRKPRGQGALEYLLLIGGAVIVGTIVVTLLLGASGSSQSQTLRDVNEIQVKTQEIAGGTGISILTNIGFEKGITPWNYWWTPQLVGTAYSGQYAAAIINSTNYCNSYIWQDIDSPTNMKYDISGYTKTINETGTSGIFISEGVGTGCTEWARMNSRDISGTNDWTYQSIMGWNSNSCTKVRFGFHVFQCNSSGQSYFDLLVAKKSG